jgi:hypothetical protein
LNCFNRIFILFFFFLLFTISYAQDLFDAKHTATFANYLQTSKQYKLASEEYERLLFFNPKNDTVLSKFFYNLRKSGDAKSVINKCQKLYSNSDSVSAVVFTEYVKSILIAEPHLALTLLEKNKNITSHEKKMLLAYTNISSYKWNEALANISAIEQQTSPIIQSKEILSKAVAQHHKKPILAAGLSAILPGLGKVYSGNLKDGIIALVFVGINGFQSYRYFNKKGIKSAGGWIFGSLATGFYLGNIYGSYKAAVIKNKKINDAYKKQLQEITDMD